jgi:peptidoglycan hydrolase-like protein with peptidoglycan-binding domain
MTEKLVNTDEAQITAQTQNAMSIKLICPTHRPTLYIGSQGLAVSDLQQAINSRLDLLGIPSELVAQLQIDADFGPATLNAVEYLQCLSFIAVDGVVGVETWAALCEGSNRLPILGYGSTGVLVTAVQTLLQDLGYYRAYIDGEFGAWTQAAVQQYQKAHQLYADGVIRSLTWDKLSKDCSGHGPRCFVRVYGSVVVD